MKGLIFDIHSSHGIAQDCEKKINVYPKYNWDRLFLIVA